MKNFNADNRKFKFPKIIGISLSVVLILTPISYVYILSINQEKSLSDQINKNNKLSILNEPLNNTNITPIKFVSNESQIQTEQIYLTYTSEKGVNLKILSPDLENNFSCSGKISGKITSSWFFEGSFPIEITSKGVVLETIIAEAEGDWTNTGEVAFSAKYECIKCDTGADLVFSKANPSGLKENDDTITVPINFDDCKKS